MCFRLHTEDMNGLSVVTPTNEVSIFLQFEELHLLSLIGQVWWWKTVLAFVFSFMYLDWVQYSLLAVFPSKITFSLFWPVRFLWRSLFSGDENARRYYFLSLAALKIFFILIIYLGIDLVKFNLLCLPYLHLCLSLESFFTPLTAF